MGTTESILSETSVASQHGHSKSSLDGSQTHVRRRRSSGKVAEASGPQVRLTGVILGLPRSGRHTLLQRLQGKDPFASTDSEKVTVETALVPYQVSRGQTSWDRIQLQVHVLPEIPLHDNDDPPSVDFTVFLVDPRHDREVVSKYLSKSITSLLNLQGYLVDSESSNSSASKFRKAFCLCVLLNFRDEIHDTRPKTTDLITESDLQLMTLTCLQESCPDLEPAQLHIQCATTSLYNCYGLGVLHHYIYQVYLHFKQWHLRNSLCEVQNALNSSRHTLPTTMSYEDYVHKLVQPHQSSGKHEKASHPSVTSTESCNSIVQKAQTDRRKFFSPEKTIPSNQQVQNIDDNGVVPLSNTKNALEAFLASDDEADNPRMVTGPTKAFYSSDDDDDDFFYDEHGQRQNLEKDTDSETE